MSATTRIACFGGIYSNYLALAAAIGQARAAGVDAIYCLGDLGAFGPANTSAENRRYLRSLPAERRLSLGPLRVLLCHGSPRKVNEFLWESTTPTHFLEKLADDYAADVILAMHTGIRWQRAEPLAASRWPGRRLAAHRRFATARSPPATPRPTVFLANPRLLHAQVAFDFVDRSRRFLALVARALLS